MIAAYVVTSRKRTPRNIIGIFQEGNIEKNSKKTCKHKCIGMLSEFIQSEKWFKAIQICLIFT